MVAKLKRNQPYTPGKPLFPRIRPFVPAPYIPKLLVVDAYEMLSGESVTVNTISETGPILGTFIDHTGARTSSYWFANGESSLPRNHEYARALQVRADFFERYRTFLEGLEDQYG